jgi:hypothetical protein
MNDQVIFIWKKKWLTKLQYHGNNSQYKNIRTILTWTILHDFNHKLSNHIKNVSENIKTTTMSWQPLTY